jgi:hypothetical protein
MVDKKRVSEPEEREITDRNRDGIDDEIEPPIPDVAAGSEQLSERFRQNTSTDPTLSGGDVDARWDETESTGDEGIAGSMPTPDQSDVDDAGRGMGVTYQDDEPLKLGEKERQRDRKRWELDAASSEDYRERQRDLASVHPDEKKKQ